MTLINGIQFGWSNITLILFGSPVIGITKIDYKSDQKKENIMGFGNQPIGRGYGNYDYPDGSIEILQEEWYKIIQNAPNGDPLQIPYFNMTVQYGGRGVVTTKDKIYNVEFTSNPLVANQGDTSLKVTIPFIFAGLDHFTS